MKIKIMFILMVFCSLLFSIKRSDELSKLKKFVLENKLPFEVGFTSISQYKLEEVTGLQVPKDFNPSIKYKELPKFIDLPDKLDYRELGYVTPVKNQRNCGACWAFATIAPLESAILMYDNKTQDLSEQALISCNPWGFSCDGGWYAFDMFIDDGAALESCQPYTGSDKTKCNNCPGSYYILDWNYVSAKEIPSIDEIKTAILIYGPVAAGMYASNAFMFYKGGVWTKDEEGDINHAITIVGWDDTKNPPAWIIKNSWGNDWGENGFAYVTYGILKVGYAPAFVTYKASTWEDIYEPNNTPNEAREISINEIQKHKAQDVDWVYFTLDPACTYFIYTNNLSSGSDTVITLYEEDGSTKIDENDDYNRNSQYSVLFIKPQNTKKYYLKVDQLFDYSENYFYYLGLKTLHCEFK